MKIATSSLQKKLTQKKMENIQCSCGQSYTEYEWIGEDAMMATAYNTVISKDGYGKSCYCKSCKKKYDSFDPCIVVSVAHRDYVPQIEKF